MRRLLTERPRRRVLSRGGGCHRGSRVLPVHSVVGGAGAVLQGPEGVSQVHHVQPVPAGHQQREAGAERDVQGGVELAGQTGAHTVHGGYGG